MEFSGDFLTIKRSFYTQTGNYNFLMNCYVDNTTGQYLFGFSGNGNTLEFKLESGKMYFNNQFIHTYRSYEPFILDAEFSNLKYNIIKDGIPLIYDLGKTTGYFDYFYFKRNILGINAVFDLSISGNNFPRYTVSNKGYLFSTGQVAVTGYFGNQSQFPIKIFDSNIIASQNYEFAKIPRILQSNASGFFAYSGNYSSVDTSQPILTTFNTNFGDISISFNVIDTTSYNKFVFLQDIENFSFDDTGILNRYLSYNNYSGGFATDNFETNIIFALDYISGSGDYLSSGNTGQLFSKTFSGSWEMFTGFDQSTLYPVKMVLSQNGLRITGGGNFPSNDTINFQINHIVSGIYSDAAYFLISGVDVLNPISTRIDLVNNSIPVSETPPDEGPPPEEL